MEYRLFWTTARAVLGAAALLVGGCSGAEGASGEGSLQSTCVLNQLTFDRTLVDGQKCSNFGYRGCQGSASDCINYCAFGFCQPEECETAADCYAYFEGPGTGLGFVCEDYLVSGASYGSWCHLTDVCTEGTMNCPCAPGDVCGPDLFGTGNMSCVAGTCESACPSACIVGSVCCGGAFCAGNCIGTPCCS